MGQPTDIPETPNTKEEILDRSLFDLDPKVQEKINIIGVWVEESKHRLANVPFPDNPPPRFQTVVD